MDTPGKSLPLAGYNVLDLGTRPSTAWCARLLADFGAKVIGIEETPHPLRAYSPFDSAGTSIHARYFLANRTIQNTYDAKLCADAHIVLTSEPQRVDEIVADNPNALVCVRLRTSYC